MATISVEVSKQLYRRLFMVRRCEERIRDLYPEDQMMTPMHMSMGQEAVSVGVCAALGEQCDVTASYRSHAAFLARTGDHSRFFGELYGRQNGTASGKGGSMHVALPDQGVLTSTGIVSAGIPVAVGAAFANVYMRKDRISVAFFGDGGTDEGVFWESLNAACVMKLPMLFVCEDNDIAVHTRKQDRRGYGSLIDVASQYNCIVGEDDSNDVERIHELVAATVRQMREMHQPGLLNIKTYRYLEPVGIEMDTDAPYRRKEEDRFWKDRDCVVLQRARLLKLGLVDTEIADIEENINGDIELSIERARNAPPPLKPSLDTGVFYEKA